MNQELLLELVANGELTEEGILAMGKEVRRGLLVDMLKDGIPSASKDQYRMMKLLEDMDGSALAKLKIGSDDDNADADRRAQLMIASMQRNLEGANPLKAGGGQVGHVPSVVAGEIPTVTAKPGEDSVGISELTYKEFSKED